MLLEVCRDRQIRDDFSNGPGRQMRDYLSTGPGRKMKDDFSNGPGFKRRKTKNISCQSVLSNLLFLLLLLLLLLLLMNTFPNLHLVCSFHNTDLLITFGIDFEWLCFEWRFFFKPNWFFRNILGLLKRLNILLLIDKSYIYFLNKAFFMAELSAFFLEVQRGESQNTRYFFSILLE